MDLVHYSMNLLALVICIIMGALVLGTNVHRLSNRAFVFFSLVIGFWLICRIRIIKSTEIAEWTFWIRQAFASALLIPAAANLLRITIAHPDQPNKTLFKDALPWFIASTSFAILCQTPWVVESVHLSPNGTPEPNFALPGLVLCITLFAVAVIGLTASFVRSLKNAAGLQRLELQFVMLGYSLGIGFGFFTSLVLPAFEATANARQLAPFGVVILNGWVAYGIATRRIMHVSAVIRRCATFAILVCFMTLLFLSADLAFKQLLLFLHVQHALLADVLAVLTTGFAMGPSSRWVRSVVDETLVDQRAQDAQSSIKKAAELLQSVTNFDHALPEVASLIGHALNTDHVTVILRRNQHWVPVYQSAETSPVTPLPTDNALVRQLSEIHLPIVTDALLRQPPNPRRREIMARLKSHHVEIAVGIRYQDELLGMLLLGPRRNRRVYALSEQETLTSFCHQIGVKLENLRLYTLFKDSKRYNATLLEHMVSGVVSLGKEGHITTCNREAERILGKSESQIKGCSVDTLPPSLRDAFYDTLRDRSPHRNIEVEILSAEGKINTHARLDTTLIQSHDSDEQSVMLMFQDVTVLKQMEHQIRRSDRLASIGTLSAGMAHEIKNPLVSLKTFTQLLPERYEDPDFRDTFSAIVGDEVDRIDHIVSQVLEFARPAKPHLAPVRLHRIISSSLGLLGQKLRGEDIVASVNLTATDDTILGDTGQISQVMVNLVLNAAEAMPKGGTIHITTIPSTSGPFQDEPHGSITCCIQDTGEGISPDLIDQVFDPFFTTKDSGTGLGLSIVHGILEEHGAAMTVDSIPGEGTQFYLHFRLNPERVPATEKYA